MYAEETLTTAYKDVTNSFTGDFNIQASSLCQLFITDSGDAAPTTQKGMTLESGVKEVMVLGTGQKLYAKTNTGTAILRMNG